MANSTPHTTARGDVFIVLTSRGNVKRFDVDAIRSIGTGGRSCSDVSDADAIIRQLVVVAMHHRVLFITNKGRMFGIEAGDIPEVAPLARGTPLEELLQVAPGEAVTAIFAIAGLDRPGYLIIGTGAGVVKKTEIAEFRNLRRNGLRVIRLDEGDEVVAVEVSDGSNDLVLSTQMGHVVRFGERDVRPMGSAARGVRAITMAPADIVAAVTVTSSDARRHIETPDTRRHIVFVSARGFAKRVPVAEYRSTSRGGPGVKAMANSTEIGALVGHSLVTDEKEVVLATTLNRFLHVSIGALRAVRRNAKGSKILRLTDEEMIVATATL